MMGHPTLWLTIAKVDVDSVGVAGRDEDEVGERVSSRSVATSWSVLADDDGDS